MSNQEIIRIEGISKRFGGVQALADVSLSIQKGEVHALVGENGAGKSTLMKILAGVYKPDVGKIFLRGQEIHFESPRQALELGISIVFQELNLFPALTIAENIFINRERQGRLGLLDKSAMWQHSQYLLRSLGLEIDPNTRVRELSVGERQIVEIARALSHEADIIIMDEPNSALTDQETQTLFEIIRSLKERGVTIIFVSHRLEEVFCIADRISILRDGRYIRTERTSETTIPRVISSMIGREVRELFPPRPQRSESAKPVLEIKGMAKHGRLQPIDFQVFEGEILGFAGLEGCGREDLFRGLFGLETFDRGEMFYLGRRVELRSASDAIKLGWGLIPPDRRELGLMLNWPILDNTVLVILDQIRSFMGLIDRYKAREITEYFVDGLGIETDSVYKQVANLSGGNQQKVALAKWLATNPKVLILDDPTRGIDVGSKSEIYRLMDKLSRKGVAILFTSSELDEIIGMSDRIIVLYKGYKVLECSRGEVTKEEILHYVNGKGLVGGIEPEYLGGQGMHRV